MALWKEDYVVKNKFSRPAYKLLTVKGIIMHWTGSAGAGDENHQKYFDGSDGGGSRYASAHIFIDRDSSTLIIPLDEVAYHANEKPSKVAKLKASASYYTGGNANLNTIGIEMCLEKDGTIHADTVKRSVAVVAELCKKFKLNPLNDVYRHYDITGKNCPAPWVSDSSKFTKFKKDVNTSMNAETKPKVTTPVVKPVTNKDTHKVVKGDTLWALASTYGTTVTNLQKLNPDTKSGVLEIGQVLKLKETVVTKPKIVEKPKAVAPKPVAPKPVAKPKPKTVAKPKTAKLTYSKTLKKDSKGNDVKALQNALNSLNFKCGTADGVYGNDTKDAVTRFQKVYLPKEVDGIAGKNTINKINSLLK